MISDISDIDSIEFSDDKKYTGVTALMVAKNAEITRLLLEYDAEGGKADVNATDPHGFTALMYANTYDQMHLLLQAGANVNAKTIRGYTALMFTYDVEQTRLLIIFGADVNARTDDGFTALTLAKTDEQKILLLENGAKDFDNVQGYPHEQSSLTRSIFGG